ILRPPPRSPLFPYTTLFRSAAQLPAIAPAPAPEVAGAVGGAGVRATGRQPQGLRSARGHRGQRDHAGRAAPGRGAVAQLAVVVRSEEHTSELQSRSDLVCRL